MSQNICKNCNHKFNGNYCNHCGQVLNTHPIDLKYLIHELQHGFFHVDKGILFTLKELFTRPGDTIREFINGKRVNHFKPVISLVIILATIYGLLAHYFAAEAIDMSKIIITGNNNLLEDILKIKKWISDHFVWVSLFSIPLFSIGSFLAFRKHKLNFVVHIVLNIFLTGQKLAFHIIIFPLFYFFRTTSYNNSFDNLLSLIDFVLLVWTYKGFFKSENTLRTIWLSILSYMIYIFTIILLSIATIAIVYVINQ